MNVPEIKGKLGVAPPQSFIKGKNESPPEWEGFTYTESNRKDYFFIQLLIQCTLMYNLIRWDFFQIINRYNFIFIYLNV